MFIARRFSCQCAKDRKSVSGLSQKMANQLEKMSLEELFQKLTFILKHEKNACSSLFLFNLKTITNKVPFLFCSQRKKCEKYMEFALLKMSDFSITFLRNFRNIIVIIALEFFTKNNCYWYINVHCNERRIQGDAPCFTLESRAPPTANPGSTKAVTNVKCDLFGVLWHISSPCFLNTIGVEFIVMS